MQYSTKLIIAALAASSMIAWRATAAPSSGPVVSTTDRSDLKTEADAIVAAAYPADGPGAAVIMTRHGEVLYASGRGLADMERGTPITPDTVFRVGSIAKQFTAAVILQLVHEGLISLDDPPSRFFPEWPQPGATATVRQLLNHTSGIKDFSKIPGWIQKNSDRTVTTAELVKLTESLGSKAAPGVQWEYNNGGYVILGAIVEKVTGKRWYEAVEERIARPLGLASLRYAAAAAGAPEVARGYGMHDGHFQRDGAANMSIAGAAGGLVADVRDMAKWAEALHRGKVVPPELYKEMIAPARLSSGATYPYGFGLHLEKLVGHQVLAHGGAGRGIDTASAYFPADDVFVAVFANSDDLPTDANVVLRRLGALAIGSPLPRFTQVKVDPKTIEPLFGIYGSKGGPEFRFFRRDGHYFIGRGDDELQLLPAGGDRFYSARTGLDWVKFVRRADAATLELYDPSEADPERYSRLGALPADVDVKVPLPVLRSYVGEYQTELLPVTVTLGSDGKLTMQPKGQPPLPMRPISQTEFKMDGNIMRVVFHPGNGRVDSFTIHRGARELHGKRIPK